MSEVKQFHLREGTLVEGKSLGCLNVYLASDYDQLKAENDALMIQSMHRGEQLLTLRKQLDEATVLMHAVASGVTCNTVHHCKADRHMHDEPCPVVGRFNAWMEASKCQS